MERTDNYQIQVQQAQARFLTYDQDALICKMKLEADEDFLYLPMLSRKYRISRKTGRMDRLTDTGWVGANSHGEVMTALDLICDSRPDRFLTGKWKAMTGFGLLFHQSLAENPRDPWAERFDADPEGFRRACEALGGEPVAVGDMGYAVELFDGLRILLQLWFGDEEFPPSLRLLWDENALMYIKYETMWFAKGLLFALLAEQLDK